MSQPASSTGTTTARQGTPGHARVRSSYVACTCYIARPDPSLLLLSNIGSAHWPRVEAMDLLPRVHHAFPSFKLGAVKPDQEYFRRALNVMNISPDEAIFFDDNQINCDGAQAFGIAAYCTRGVEETRGKLVELGLL